jgi:hypothetical protein
MPIPLTLNDRELSTVLGSLRLYQEQGADLGHPSAAVDDVLTNGGQHTSLTAKEVDALCERLNAAVA